TRKRKRRPGAKNLPSKFAWKRRPCRRWVTSLFVRTRRTIPLHCGSGTKRRNSCPEEERSFVVTSKTERKPKIRKQKQRQVNTCFYSEARMGTEPSLRTNCNRPWIKSWRGLKG